MKRESHAVRGAYDVACHDAACPTCGAEPFVWCRHPDGRVRWIPCVARLERRDDPEWDQPPPDPRIVRNNDCHGETE